MSDDSFPPFPFPANAEPPPPPMPKEKKARKAKEAKPANGRRRRKGRRRKHAAPPETNSAPRNVPVAKVAHDDLVTVSVDDIKFINGVLQSMQAFPRKQQERIIIALSKVFG